MEWEWKKDEFKGNLIHNGEFCLLVKQKDITIYIDAMNGEFLDTIDFEAFDVQLDSPL